VLKRHTNFVGVLGWPLDHTLSPVIHNAAFRRLDLDWTYLGFPVEPASLRDAVAGLRALSARGANVTMPHNETVIPYLDEIGGDAASTGAVNTIENVGGRLIGHNTDVDGFRQFLDGDAGVVVAGKPVCVLGSGGAARAVVTALDGLGAEVIVVGRNVQRATSVAALASSAEVASWEDRQRVVASSAVVVNTTPLGMEGEKIVEAEHLDGSQVVVDLIYQPARTPLLEAARAAGADCWGGLGMLVHQAAASFRIWTGQEPPLEVMSAAALHAIGGGVSRGSHLS
jgi:shikimate dehydrogenase